MKQTGDLGVWIACKGESILLFWRIGATADRGFWGCRRRQRRLRKLTATRSSSSRSSNDIPHRVLIPILHFDCKQVLTRGNAGTS